MEFTQTATANHSHRSGGREDRGRAQSRSLGELGPRWSRRGFDFLVLVGQELTGVTAEPGLSPEQVSQ